MRDLPIIFENADVLVINKPAGISVHNAKPGEPSVVDLTKYKVQDANKERPGIVHRLDKYTSGIMIIAKNEDAKAWLQQQFAQRKVQKGYTALVEGKLEPPEAVINVPLGRHSKNPLKRAVRPGGKSASTYYRVHTEYKGSTLLEVRPKTGRTHQIRLHFAHVGHPIVGDLLYGHRAKGLNRQFLHAAKLTITLPDGSEHVFSAPLAPDLEQYLKTL